MEKIIQFWDWLMGQPPTTLLAMSVLAIVLLTTGLGRGIFDLSASILKAVLGHALHHWRWIVITALLVSAWAVLTS